MVHLNGFGVCFALVVWLIGLYKGRGDRVIVCSMIGMAILVSCVALACSDGDFHPPLNYCKHRSSLARRRSGRLAGRPGLPVLSFRRHRNGQATPRSVIA